MERKLKKGRSPLISLIITLAFISGIFLQGCAPVIGTMQGMLKGEKEKVIFTYSYIGVDYKAGELSVTLPDGERFAGKYVQQSASDRQVPFAFRSRGAGMEAILLGDKGNSMKCRFMLNDKAGGIDWGGIGICEVSDGRNINVQWEISEATKKWLREE